MNGSHSGNGTVKSEARKRRLTAYRTSGQRERNRDRRMSRVVRGLQGDFKIIEAAPGVLNIVKA